VARSANPTAGSVPFATSITYCDHLSPALNGLDRGSYPRGSQEEELNETSGSLRRSTGRAIDHPGRVSIEAAISSSDGRTLALSTFRRSCRMFIPGLPRSSQATSLTTLVFAPIRIRL